MDMETKPIPIGTLCKKWDYSFPWTADHISLDNLKLLRQEYDVLGSVALEQLQAIVREKGEAASKRIDYYEILRENHSKDEVLGCFWKEVQNVPEWVDWQQIERGQRFFYRYLPGNVVGFGLQGFLGENSVQSCTILLNWIYF
jgi:hypothetical protein